MKQAICMLLGGEGVIVSSCALSNEVQGQAGTAVIVDVAGGNYERLYREAKEIDDEVRDLYEKNTFYVTRTHRMNTENKRRKALLSQYQKQYKREEYEELKSSTFEWSKLQGENNRAQKENEKLKGVILNYFCPDKSVKSGNCHFAWKELAKN